MIRRALWVLAALAGGMLPGCTLIDQNTFNPNARAVPVIPVAPVAAAVAAPSGPQPLLTLRPGQPVQDAVRQAVNAARRRKSDVVFDVVAMLPGGAGTDAGIDDPASSSAAAGTVARAITAQGVPPGRVRLFARPETGLAGQEVRVYVR